MPSIKKSLSSQKGSSQSGNAWIWISACALSLSLFMIVGVLLLVASKGFAAFWPSSLVEFEINLQGNTTHVMGETIKSEFTTLPEKHRFLLKTGNRDIAGQDFSWYSKKDITTISYPEKAMVLERMEWGNFYGFPKEIVGPLQSNVNNIAELREAMERILKEGDRSKFALLAEAANGDSIEIPFEKIVRFYSPNDLSFIGKLSVYIEKLAEYLWENPREANTEGGVFPAIFGTLIMVLVMSIMVTPMGILAAIYLHEYAGKSAWMSFIRIAIYNLAGVPSIVYGVFGLGFFVYFLGGNLDALFFSDTLPAPTLGTPGLLWASLTLAILTLPVVIVSTEEGLSRVPRTLREGSLALGATKAETIWKVVLPQASPAMMTGLILAVARAAGEVAPLMLVGVVKMAPDLAIDGSFPFLHLDRKIMHLGFHIYDLGFQSPNVEAARPFVFATALTLVLLIVGLNLAAITIRNKLQNRYKDMTH